MRIKVMVAALAVLFSMFSPLVIIARDRETEEIPQSEIENESELYFGENLASDCEVSILMGDERVYMDIEKYILGVVAGEMPATFTEEALMAQAVAARTYTLHKMWVNPSENHDENVCTDPACCKAYADERQLRENWGEDYETYMSKIRYVVLTEATSDSLAETSSIPS